MGKVKIDAKEAVAELASLVVKMKEVRGEISKIKNNSTGSYDEMERASKSLRTNLAALTARITYLQKTIEKEAESQKKATKEKKKATTATNKNASAINKNTKRANKSTKANKKLSLSLKELIKGYGLFSAVQFLKDILIQTYEQIKTFDSLRFTLQLLNETVQDYNSANRFMMNLTKDFGVELIATTNRYIKFSAAADNAGLSVRETENIFRSMTKAGAALGLKTDELSGIYLALEQMLSKGKVTTEELRRQLGERLPGAMGIMASAIGVTIPKLDEMLRKGEVLSADVLPEFADAVEIAYGIENVKKIDTLVAAQNRLVTAWQTLIKTISEGDGVVRKSVSWILDSFAELTYKVTAIIGGEQFFMKEAIAAQEKNVLDRLKLFAKERLNPHKNYADNVYQIEKDLASLKEKLLITGGLKERAVISSQIEEKEKLLVDYNKKIKDLQVTIAKELFPATVEPFIEATNKYNKILKDFEEVKSGKKVKSIYSQDDLDEARNNLINATADWATYKKFVEDSKVVVPEGDKNLGRLREMNLKEIASLEKEFQIAVLRRKIEHGNDLIESDKATFKEKINLIKARNQQENNITQLQAEIEIEKAEKTEKEKIKAINKAISEGAIMTGVDPEVQKVDLAKERADRIKIIEEKMFKDIVVNNRKGQKDILGVVEEYNELYVKAVKNKYNLEIIAANEAYELTKKTEEDKIKFQDEIKKISIQAANEQIDAQIKIRKALLSNADLSKDSIAQLILEINELEASKSKFFDKNGEIISEESELWEELLELAAQYSRALGDLLDAISAKKIENIDAEIDAEKRKYDKLIELADGDAEQQKTLRRDRDEAIEALEKKRLKELQKQAKIRKAFAIADIAISTAVAIAKVLEQTGIFGLAAWIPVAALGALQTAAVLATPIPQFKEGGVSDKNQIAMINDGKDKEYVKRGNSLLSTDSSDAIVNLKKDDVIYKNYDEMINKELLNPNGINPIGMDEFNFNRLFFGIESSISEGFKNAKINNIVKVINKVEDNNYKHKLSRW